jgi:hypothetical protein
MSSINSVNLEEEKDVSTLEMSPEELFSGITGPVFNYTDKPLSIDDLNRLSTPKHVKDDLYKIVIDGKKYDYNTQKARDYMLSRYKQKFKIDPDNFFGFDQGKNTCWFNSTCMALFANTYGIEYFNYFRKFMVTGKNVHGDKLDESYAKPLWLLNAMLDSIYRGNRITGDYPNQLVIGLYNAFKGNIFQGKPGKGYNSAAFIEEMLSSIDLNKMRIAYLFNNFIPGKVSMIEYLRRSKIVNQYNVLYFTLRHMDKQRIPLTFTNGDAEFKLGSAILYNNLTKKRVGHAIAGLMIDDVPYIYDGEFAKMNRTLQKIDWTVIVTDNEEVVIPYGNEKKSDGNTYGGYICFPIYFRIR